MSGIGHNNGPSMERGHGFRRYAWAKARRNLLPALPLEIIKTRVARAERLGLPYRTYASIRLGTGEDITAFLFSSNALGLIRATDMLSVPTQAKLASLEAERHAVLAQAIPYDALPHFKSARRAPGFGASWSGLSQDMRNWLRTHRLAHDRVVMVGATALEREHATAGRLAAFLPGSTYFPEAHP